ncbi:MAG: MotA/TolQ/ExbB proton channel family protein, partial [Chryseotalea sp.]
MKKQLAIFALVGVLFSSTISFAQETTAAADTTKEEAVEAAPEVAATDEVPAEEPSFHEVLKDKFIQGGTTYMWPILICLILGLAISIERIITLNMATTNTKKLLESIESALSKGGVDAALNVTKNTKGPVASIFTQGLMRYHEGVDMV